MQCYEIGGWLYVVLVRVRPGRKQGPELLDGLCPAETGAQAALGRMIAAAPREVCG